MADFLVAPAGPNDTTPSTDATQSADRPPEQSWVVIEKKEGEYRAGGEGLEVSADLLAKILKANLVPLTDRMSELAKPEPSKTNMLSLSNEPSDKPSMAAPSQPPEIQQASAQREPPETPTPIGTLKLKSNAEQPKGSSAATLNATASEIVEDMVTLMRPHQTVEGMGAETFSPAASLNRSNAHAPFDTNPKGERLSGISWIGWTSMVMIVGACLGFFGWWLHGILIDRSDSLPSTESSTHPSTPEPAGSAASVGSTASLPRADKPEETGKKADAPTTAHEPVTQATIDQSGRAEAPQPTDQEDKNNKLAELVTEQKAASQVSDQGISEPAVVKPVEPPASGYNETVKRAQALMHVKKFKAAATELLKAIEINPTGTDAMVALANVYFELGKNDQAIRMAERALKINPNHADAHLALGTAYQTIGNNKKAIEAYQTYLKLKPDAPLASEVRAILKSLQ